MSNSSDLLQEAHKELLVRLHAANAGAPRHEHEFTIRNGEYVGEANRVIVGGGLAEPLPALDADLGDLVTVGLLRYTGHNYIYGNRFLLTPEGVRYAQRLSQSPQLKPTAERAAAPLDAREAVVLRWLNDDAPSGNRTLALTHPERVGELPEFNSRELDELLDRARRAGWARGDREPADGSNAFWSGLHITALGLVHLGEWDHLDPLSTWNRRDRLVLEYLVDNPARDTVLFTHPGGEQPHSSGVTEGEFHRSLELLVEGGYVEAERSVGTNWQDVVVSATGRDRLSTATTPAPASGAVTRRTLAGAARRAVERTWRLPLRESVTPFDAEEVRRLQRYSRKAHELQDSALLSHPTSLTVRSLTDGSLSYELEYAGDDALRGAVVAFRSLYDKREAENFAATRDMIRRHAVDASCGGALIALLDELGGDVGDLLAGAGRLPVTRSGLGEDDKLLKVSRILEIVLYGDQLHADADKQQALEDVASRELVIFLFADALRAASVMYSSLAELVDRILADHELAYS